MNPVGFATGVRSTVVRRLGLLVAMLLVAAGLAAIPAGAAAPASLRFKQQVLGTVDGLPFDLVVRDFDGRPPADVAISVNRGIFERGGLQLVLNQGEGFKFGPFVVGGIAPYTIDAGDVDGDGDLDAVAPTTASDDISVYMNDGAGNFKAALRLAAPRFPRGVAVADYNGDGREDAATSAQPIDGGSAVLLVFYRNADNTGFDPPIAIEPASGADNFHPLEALVAGDFNTDGLTDIAGIDEITGKLLVSHRKPDHSGFAPVATASLIDRGAVDVAAGDLNRDGLTDFALTNIFGPRVAVLLRRTDDSGFMPPQYFDVTGITSKVAIADIDGDRRNDVAVSLLNAGKVAVILRRRNNRGFQAPLFFNVGDHPVALDAADIDADSDTDLVVGDRDSQDIRLLLNQRHHRAHSR